MTTREKSLAILESAGFRVASSLPTVRSEQPTTLRPLHEVAGRLCALAALFVWVVLPETDLPSSDFDTSVWDHLAGDETTILTLPRSEAHLNHVNTIGWRLENMWPLAWILGFEPPPGIGGHIDPSIQDRLLRQFVGAPGISVAVLLSRATPRAVQAVDDMEDLFYCAHNSVRSAQTGRNTVPEGFHPIIDGGAVHERRHSLTWALSPGVSWDDTDLST